MLARLATRRAKPAGTYHLLLADLPTFLAPLHINDLHGFGRATRDKALEKLGTTELGVLAQRSRAALCDALGRGTGETLFNALRGIDERRLESDKPRKSVSCEINVCFCVYDFKLVTDLFALIVWYPVRDQRPGGGVCVSIGGGGCQAAGQCWYAWSIFDTQGHETGPRCSSGTSQGILIFLGNLLEICS